MASPSSFEPVPGARHRIEIVDGTEWITVNAVRNWFVLVFISVWLIGWTFGGIGAMTQMVGEEGGPRLFLLVWLVMWAFGWIMAASTVAWQIGGKTRVGVMAGVTGAALVHRLSLPLFSRTKHYDVLQVRRLRTAGSPLDGLFGIMARGSFPPFLPGRGVNMGAIAFDYGARTVRLLPEIDEAEGAMVTEWLARRLPASATA
jgi:hypothetical protein